jgi:hypothetical protein
MLDRLSSFSGLRIYCQNVNRNYGFLDSLLASLYEDFDLLFIQEPPWQFIRSAPSSSNREGEDVIGHPISPNWGSIVRSPNRVDATDPESGAPCVMVYFNIRIASLKPAFRRDLFDHRDILLFSLGLGGDTQLFANVYSDKQHTAIRALYEDVVAIPKLHFMCGDFNVRHTDWDPLGPEVNIHATSLTAVATTVGLHLSTPVEAGPTHFPYNEDLTPTVIDLFFVPAELSLMVQHEIHADMRGTSDHAPLTVTLPGPRSRVPVTRWAIKVRSDEEAAYKGQVLSALEPLFEWQDITREGIDEVVLAISGIFSAAWKRHAVEKRRGKHSNGWWSQECVDSLQAYRETRLPEDWKDYRRIMRQAKRDFFEERIHEVASTNQRAWDLMAWTRKRNLPSHESIS